MSEKFTRPRRRHRRAGVLATLTAAATMLVNSFGAAPAQAQTQTAWIPLFCGLAESIPVHMGGVALTATVPDEVHPGDTFSITGTTTQTVFSPIAQRVSVVFDADGIQGIVGDFETNLTNATVSFADTAGGDPAQSGPSQFNAVAAVQPPNQAASNVRINGGDTTRGGFQPATPAETFSFGDAPLDSSGASPNVYAPAPGVGGGFAPGSGTPDVLPDIGPITVTGNVGDDVVIKNVNPGGPDVAGLPGGNPRIASTSVAFHRPSGEYTAEAKTDCAYDTSPPGPGAMESTPRPDPSYVDQFTIPIQKVPFPERGSSASARGTDPDATIGAGTTAAQFSAITNCDETAPVKPFYVRYTNEGTHTFKLTNVDDSTCINDGSNTNLGTGSGTIDGSGSADVSWSFADAPDAVHIEIAGGPTVDAAPPAALNGSPGGVWVFGGDLPWPSGGGA